MSVTATVKVTLKMRVNSTWGDECTASQIKKQALDDANGMLNKVLEKDERITVSAGCECISIEYYT